MQGVPAGGPVDPATSLLQCARDRFGQSSEEWTSRALAGADGPVLDIRCAWDQWLELRRDGVGSSGVVLARPGRLPLRRNGIAGVRATMCLPVVRDLDDLFAELRRVLRPTGTVAALVPARPVGSLAEVRAWWPLRDVLHGHPGFRNASARDHLGWLFAAADFAVLGDQRRTFWLPIPDGESAARLVDGLVVAGVWPPDVEPERLRQAREALVRYAAPGRAMPLPMRLLVARR